MRRFVGNPPVHMNDLYLEIACSEIQDSRFSAAEFGRQPVRHILKVVDYVRKRERRMANDLSSTTAQLAEIVAIFASQGKAALKPHKLLPYPQEAEANDQPRISAAVAQSIRQCIRDRTLPLDVLVLLRPDLENADALA
jgi:hypothetical protein